jgi:hypothetical protein
MARDIGRPMEGRAFEQRRAHDQGIGFVKEGRHSILRPGASLRRSSPDGDIDAAAQLLMKRRRRRHRHFDLRSPGMKLLKAGNQPTKGEGRRSADSQEPADGRPAACFGGRCHPIEGQAHFGGEGASGGRRRHPSARPNEEALAEPSFEHGDLPTDCAMRQSEFGSGFGIAARPSCYLEDAQSVERKGTTHFEP